MIDSSVANMLASFIQRTCIYASTNKYLLSLFEGQGLNGLEAETGKRRQARSEPTADDPTKNGKKLIKIPKQIKELKKKDPTSFERRPEEQNCKRGRIGAKSR